MNIYLVCRKESDLDEYDSCVVIAKNEDDARTVHPDDDWGRDTWVSYDKRNKLLVDLIGKALKGSKRGVVLASFNAA
jgi:hypothetical protein